MVRVRVRSRSQIPSDSIIIALAFPFVRSVWELCECAHVDPYAEECARNGDGYTFVEPAKLVLFALLSTTHSVCMLTVGPFVCVVPSPSTNDNDDDCSCVLVPILLVCLSRFSSNATPLEWSAAIPTYLFQNVAVCVSPLMNSPCCRRVLVDTMYICMKCTYIHTSML